MSTPYPQAVIRCFHLNHWSTGAFYQYRFCTGALNFFARYATPQDAWNAIDQLDWFRTADDHLHFVTRESALRAWLDFAREIDPLIYNQYSTVAVREVAWAVELSKKSDTPIESNYDMANLYALVTRSFDSSDNDYRRMLIGSVERILEPEQKAFGYALVRGMYDLLWLHFLLYGSSVHYRNRLTLDLQAITIFLRHHPLVPIRVEYF